jgi:spore maturation protein SpmA
VAKASTDSAKSAIELAIGLVGVLTLWLGLMRILQDGGYLQTLARWLRPLTRRLFPDVPPDHPAMSLMILNFTSNMLGLGNAATPFGIKAMGELDTLAGKRGVASDSMALTNWWARPLESRRIPPRLIIERLRPEPKSWDLQVDPLSGA